MKEKFERLKEFYRERTGVKDCLLYIFLPGFAILTPIIMLVQYLSL